MPVSISITRPTFNDNDTLDAAAFNAVALSSATVPDATAGTEGVLRLAGDLTGTAAAPTIKASVGLTGAPTAPTAGAATNTTQIASTAFVQQELATAAATTTTALALKAPLASPALTGTPTAPTAAAATNTTQIATTAYVRTEIANLVASSPGALDTLNELAAALGNDANFATTMTTALALKAPLASPALTGTPTAPTAAATTNTTQIATTAFVTTNHLSKANNLSDLASAQTARTTGLGFSDDANWHGTTRGATFGDADDHVQVAIGHSNTDKLYLKKFFGGAIEIGSYAQACAVTMVTNEFNVDTISLAFAIKANGNGRVRIGSGADDGAGALQVNGDISVDGTLGTTCGTGALAMPTTCEKFQYWRSGGVLYKIPLLKAS